MEERYDEQTRPDQIILNNHDLSSEDQAAISNDLEAVATISLAQAERHMQNAIERITENIQHLTKEKQTFAQPADQTADDDEADEEVDRCAETGQEIGRLQNVADSIAAVRKRVLDVSGYFDETAYAPDAFDEVMMNWAAGLDDHGEVRRRHPGALPFLPIFHTSASEADEGLATGGSGSCYNVAIHKELKFGSHVTYVASSTCR